MEKEVETLVKVHSTQLGCLACCWLRWPHCQRQKCGNTPEESTCKYEEPKYLRWVS